MQPIFIFTIPFIIIVFLYTIHKFLLYTSSKDDKNLYYIPSFYKNSKNKPFILFIFALCLLYIMIKAIPFLPVMTTEQKNNINTAPTTTTSQPISLTDLHKQFPSQNQQINQITIIKHDNTKSPNTIFTDKIRGAAIDACDPQKQ